VDVRATYTIAAKQLRSGTVRRRPPYGGAGRHRQEQGNQLPKLVRDKLPDKGRGHNREPCHNSPEERNAV